MRKFRLMCEIITFFSDYWCWIGVILVVILPSAGLCIIKNDMQDTTYSLGKVLFLAQVGVILYSTNYIGQEYAASRLRATLLATPKRGQLLMRSEEHTSELQSPKDLVCRLLLEK